MTIERVESTSRAIVSNYSGYYLIPHLRPQAVDLERDDPAGFPAVQRLPLHSNLCTFFPTHKYPLTLFEPIPIGS